jgi:predicted 3-demethylubiquinone-9 3-methyltransferase (glyoxalase superfamily)
MRTTIIPNLWFDGNAEEAAAFYTSLFPNSRITAVTRYPANSMGPEGSVMTVEYELDGQRFVGINGGSQFTFSEAVSFLVECDTQEEIDHWWSVLGEGGEEGPCGWLKDRFGLSWQVAPRGMDRVFAGGDEQAAERAFQAMMTMKKLDLEALRRAAEGAPA